MSRLDAYESTVPAMPGSVEVAQFGDSLGDLVEVTEHPPDHIRTLRVIWDVIGKECKLLGHSADKLGEVFPPGSHSSIFEYRLTDRLHHFLSCPNC